MYSDKDRIRAVKLYIEFGKRIAPTIGSWAARLGAWSRAVISDATSVVIYEQAVRYQGGSTPPNRRRRQFSITLTTIVALLQPSKYWNTLAAELSRVGLRCFIRKYANVSSGDLQTDTTPRI